MKLIDKITLKKGIDIITIKSYYDRCGNRMVSINAKAFGATYYRKYWTDTSNGSWYDYWIDAHLTDGYELML